MKILLTVSRWPWPPRRGDQLRTVQMLELLGAEHRVTLLAPVPPADAAPPPEELESPVVTYRARRRHAVAGALAALRRGLPLQSSLFYQPDLGRRLRDMAPRYDLTVLQLVRLAPHLFDLGNARLAVDLIDSLSLNFAFRARVDRWWLRPALALEARRLGRWERGLTRRAGVALVVGERDRAALVERLALPPELAGRLRVVPIAAPHPPPPGAPLPPEPSDPDHAPPVIAFTGNLGYFVNADAVGWWLGEVWPAIGPELVARHPGLRVVVAGARPGPGVRRAVDRAAAGGAPVELVAAPPDIGELLARATVSVAPMRCGSGVPLKVLEAWSAGVPVVASEWAAAGTTGLPGEDLLVADSVDDWRRALGGLLDDPASRRRLAAAGRARLAADYAPEAVGRRLAAALAEVLPARRRRGGATGVETGSELV